MGFSQRTGWRLPVTLGAATAALSIAGACLQCGPESGVGVSDAASDTRTLDGSRGDASTRVDAADSGRCALLSDGAVGEWEGYTRAHGISACCAIDTSDNPGKSLPPLTWSACKSGRLGCTELDLGAWSYDSPVAVAQVWTDAKGSPNKLRLLLRDASRLLSDKLDYAT